MKCIFQLTYFYDLLTYLKTIGAMVVLFGIKPKLMKCRFELTYFCDLLTLSLRPTLHPHLPEHKRHIRISSIHSSTTFQSVLITQKKFFVFHPHPTQHDNILQC
jgi:hypothetical protein